MAKQKYLEPINYHRALIMELDLTDEDQLMALEIIRLNKLKVMEAYNKHVKKKEFKEGNLIWKTILPIRTKVSTFGKWSQNWKSPLNVSKVIHGGAYQLIDM